jgi:hypothetical protein
VYSEAVDRTWVVTVESVWVGKALVEVRSLVSPDVNDKIPVSVVQCRTGTVDVIVLVTTEVMRRVFVTTERHASAAAKGRPPAMKMVVRILDDFVEIS